MRMPEQQPYAEPEDRETCVSDLVLRYGVILGKRFTRGQKRRFLAAAAQQFQLCGFGVALEEDKHSVKAAGAKKFLNLYAGDIQKADVVYVTYYDTPAASFPSRSARAFEAGFRAQDLWVSMAGLAAIVAAVAALIWNFVWPRLAASGVLSLWGALFVACCVGTLAVVTNCREGFAKRDNMVRNSSSLSVLFELAHEARSTGLDRKVAFALVDEGCRSERGIEMLRERLGRRRPRLVYVDSLGSDGEVVCLTNSRCPEAWEGSVRIEHLDAPRRKKFGDYLVCAGHVGDGGEVLIDASSEVTAQRIFDRADALLCLAKSL